MSNFALKSLGLGKMRFKIFTGSLWKPPMQTHSQSLNSLQFESKIQNQEKVNRKEKQ